MSPSPLDHSFFTKFFLACICVLVLLFGNVSCKNSSGSDITIPALIAELIYSRFRDPGTSLITPVLSESGAGFDASEVDSPAVIKDSSRPGGDKFVLYYEATDIGGVSTIGALSSDEEDFLPATITRTQVIGLGGGGSGYDVGATDPTVVVDSTVPYGTAGHYRMWFEGRSGAGGLTSQIIHCTSGDGMTWANFAICTGLSATFASIRIADPTVLLDGSTYKMWFEAIDSATGAVDNAGTIGYAESNDGLAWTIRDAAGNTGLAAAAVYTPGGLGTFDAYSVNSPSVVKDPTLTSGADKLYKMWYEAGDNASNTENSIGYATSSDGLTWSNPIIAVLNPSSDTISPLPFDSGDLEHPSAVIISNLPSSTEGHYLLWYTGDGEAGVTPNRIGLALGYEAP